MFSKENLVSAGLLLGCVLIVFLRLGSDNGAVASAEALTLEESKKMHSSFGGEPTSQPITMFTASWCSVCTGLEKTLTAQKIPYITVDVEKNREAALYFQRFTKGRGKAGVPLTVVGPYVVFGYDPSRILSLYGALGKSGSDSFSEPVLQLGA